jgi:SAM-dependent methyltransferase
VSDEREVLRTQAYGGSAKLRARQALWAFGEDQPATSRVTRAHRLSGAETIVDVGCGHGADLRALRRDGHRGPLIGVDFSVGMLAELEPTVADPVLADALALPLASGVADVVLAMHMLYHLGDIPAALIEFRRVLRRDGVFIASTNSVTSAPELIEPWSEAMVELGGPSFGGGSGHRFSVENGAGILGSVFGAVKLREVEGVFRVPEARIVRDYVASTDDLNEPMLPDHEAWEAVLDQVAAHAQSVIDREGCFTVTARGGIFVCRR